jgi:hypothetical protein
MEIFEIERDLAWRLPLLVIAATASRSFAVLEDDRIEVRFGVAHVTIPYSNIRDLHEREWSWLLGIGIRIAGDRTLGLIGSTRGVVQIALEQPTVRGVLFMRHPRNIAISFSKPRELIEAVQRRLS